MIDILEFLDEFANALCLTLTNLPFVKTWQIPIPKNQLLAIRKAKIIMVNMMINGVINKKKLILSTDPQGISDDHVELSGVRGDWYPEPIMQRDFKTSNIVGS